MLPSECYNFCHAKTRTPIRCESLFFVLLLCRACCRATYPTQAKGHAVKRRNFLTAALATLFAADTIAAPQKKNNKKTAKKTPNKKNNRSRSTNAPQSRRPSATPPAAAAPVVGSANQSILDKPPAGTSASRLPPVKAPALPDTWHDYEIQYKLALPQARYPLKIWLPLPLSQDTLYQRTLSIMNEGNADQWIVRRDIDQNCAFFYAHWREEKNAGWSDNSAVQLTLTTLIHTADRHFDIARRTMPPVHEDLLRTYLRSSSLIPNDNSARQLGVRIVGRIKDPVAQAKAVFDWVVDNSRYDPALPAPGTGQVRQQLENQQYGGRSADINGLFVAICRAIGIPARTVYGLRVGASQLSSSLGSEENATLAQHCRAEFYIPGYSWIPVDASDVCRVMTLEDRRKNDPHVQSLKRVLFGLWEMNWIACNMSQDLALPLRENDRETAAERLPFFIHPMSEQDGELMALLSENGVPQYHITARAVTA